jgi:ADP-ribosylglycohydrolase
MRAAEGPWLQWPIDESSLEWSRVEGMLLGLAIGDALGNTTEGLPWRDRHAAHGEIRDYLPNRRARGRRVGLPSDDTQLAFWTLEHLLEGPFDPGRLAGRLARARIFGIGRTVQHFKREIDDGTPWFEAGGRSAANRALMRIAPMLVPHVSRPSRSLWAETALSAIVTHNDSAAIFCCVAFVSMLWDLGLGRVAARNRAERAVHLRPSRARSRGSYRACGERHLGQRHDCRNRGRRGRCAPRTPRAARALDRGTPRPDTCG